MVGFFFLLPDLPKTSFHSNDYRLRATVSSLRSVAVIQFFRAARKAITTITTTPYIFLGFEARGDDVDDDDHVNGSFDGAVSHFSIH